MTRIHADAAAFEIRAICEIRGPKKLAGKTRFYRFVLRTLSWRISIAY